MSLTTTTNGAVCFQSSGNCFVDFFMVFVRNLETVTIIDYLNKCWEKDPYLTIALIFHARDRKNGKKEKNISNRAMIWLKKKKNKTYKKVLETYVNNFGSWKDVMYIAMKTINNHDELNFITEQLKKDKANLEEGKSVSLCAKWISSEKDKYNKKCSLAILIAEKLYGCDDKKMEKYRKEYIVPLRKHLDIVESHMTSSNWNTIIYDNVPSVAMKRLNKSFLKHDPERFEEYLKSIKSGEKKMKVTGILPHELVKYYLNDNSDFNETIELQWKALVDDVKSKGTLKNMIPIVDSSGSMYSGTDKNVSPIEVSIALGILIAQCVDGHFKNKIISFSESPSFHDLVGDTLFDIVNNVKQKLPVGLNTNFEAIFDMLLNIGSCFNITPDDMPKKIVCLSDMQFDAASSDNSVVNDKTLHDTIMKKYVGTKYQPPTFIYWNLNTVDKTFPVKCLSDNVAMISGFSEQLLKIFMNNDNFNAETIIYDILNDYLPYVVIDDDDLNK